jgi:Fe-S cluster assembly protein SufD
LVKKRSGSGGMMKEQYIKGNAEWYVETFRDFESHLNGQKDSSIHQIRRQAMAVFQKLGYPTTRHEEWKYTNISPVHEFNFERSKPYVPGSLRREDLDTHFFDEFKNSRMVFINGHFAADLSDLSAVMDKIRIMSLREAFEQDDNKINQVIAASQSFLTESFVSLNTAFIEDGAFLEIPDNTVVEQPIHLLFITDNQDRPVVTFPRSLIITGRSSQVRFIETFVAVSDTSYFTNNVAEIYVGQNAQVERHKILTESSEAFHISALEVFQDRDSRFIDHNISLGGNLVRNHISSEFKGEGSSCTLNGLYTANGEQHIDNHTVIDHAVGHCESHELYKGILDEKSKGVFNGKIFVRQDAQKTNAIQSNNCILLSDEATIDTKPQLEIFADDVKCTHGATVGQLDEDAFFYMRARGIAREKARNLLIYAFASEVLDKITIDTVRQRLADIFSEKLHAVKQVLTGNN